MICEKCIHNNVCKYGEARSNGLYCTGEKCKQFQDKSRCIEFPIEVGGVFYGLQETQCFAYAVFGYKWGKRRGSDEDVLFVLTVYEMEFIWGEEAFATEEEAERALSERS